MTQVAGIVQQPKDGEGKSVANFVVTLPAGSYVRNADGTSTKLTADTPVYVQQVALVDTHGDPVRDLYGAEVQREILEELRRIRLGISLLCGDPLLDAPDDAQIN
jgi:hypothetical protein